MKRVLFLGWIVGLLILCQVHTAFAETKAELEAKLAQADLLTNGETGLEDLANCSNTHGECDLMSGRDAWCDNKFGPRWDAYANAIAILGCSATDKPDCKGHNGTEGRREAIISDLGAQKIRWSDCRKAVQKQVDDFVHAEEAAALQVHPAWCPAAATWLGTGKDASGVVKGTCTCPPPGDHISFTAAPASGVVVNCPSTAADIEAMDTVVNRIYKMFGGAVKIVKGDCETRLLNNCIAKPAPVGAGGLDAASLSALAKVLGIKGGTDNVLSDEMALKTKLKIKECVDVESVCVAELDNTDETLVKSLLARLTGAIPQAVATGSDQAGQLLCTKVTDWISKWNQCIALPSRGLTDWDHLTAEFHKDICINNAWIGLSSRDDTTCHCGDACCTAGWEDVSKWGDTPIPGNKTNGKDAKKTDVTVVLNHMKACYCDHMEADCTWVKDKNNCQANCVPTS